MGPDDVARPDEGSRVRIRWLPWRPRVRGQAWELADIASFLDFDLPGFVGVILAVIVIVLFVILILPIAIFLIEIVLVAVILALLLLLRFVFRRPWIVDVTDRERTVVASYKAPHLRDARVLKAKLERLIRSGAKLPPATAGGSVPPGPPPRP